MLLQRLLISISNPTCQISRSLKIVPWNKLLNHNNLLGTIFVGSKRSVDRIFQDAGLFCLRVLCYFFHKAKNLVGIKIWWVQEWRFGMYTSSVLPFLG